MRRNKDQAEDVALLAACRDLCARAMGAATIFSLYDFSIEEVSEYLAAFFPPRRR